MSNTCRTPPLSEIMLELESVIGRAAERSNSIGYSTIYANRKSKQQQIVFYVSAAVGRVLSCEIFSFSVITPREAGGGWNMCHMKKLFFFQITIHNRHIRDNMLESGDYEWQIE